MSVRVSTSGVVVMLGTTGLGTALGNNLSQCCVECCVEGRLIAVARTMQRCVACGDTKRPGTVLCWFCWKVDAPPPHHAHTGPCPTHPFTLSVRDEGGAGKGGEAGGRRRRKKTSDGRGGEKEVNSLLRWLHLEDPHHVRGHDGSPMDCGQHKRFANCEATRGDAADTRLQLHLADCKNAVNPSSPTSIKVAARRVAARDAATAGGGRMLRGGANVSERGDDEEEGGLSARRDLLRGLYTESDSRVEGDDVGDSDGEGKGHVLDDDDDGGDGGGGGGGDDGEDGKLGIVNDDGDDGDDSFDVEPAEEDWRTTIANETGGAGGAGGADPDGSNSSPIVRKMGSGHRKSMSHLLGADSQILRKESRRLEESNARNGKAMGSLVNDLLSDPIRTLFVVLDRDGAGVIDKFDVLKAVRANPRFKALLRHTDAAHPLLYHRQWRTHLLKRGTTAEGRMDFGEFRNFVEGLEDVVVYSPRTQRMVMERKAASMAAAIQRSRSNVRGMRGKGQGGKGGGLATMARPNSVASAAKEKNHWELLQLYAEELKNDAKMQVQRMQREESVKNMGRAPPVNEGGEGGGGGSPDNTRHAHSVQSTDLKEYWGELRRAARDKLDAMHLELHRGAVAAVVSDLFEFIHPVDQGG